MIEDKLQAQIYAWYNNTYCLTHHNPRHMIFSVPNGGLRSKIEAMKMKSTGLLAGVSDLIIVRPGETLFIELKTDTGVQSKEQKEFQNRIELLGFSYYLVRSLQEFQQIIK